MKVQKKKIAVAQKQLGIIQPRIIYELTEIISSFIPFPPGRPHRAGSLID